MIRPNPVLALLGILLVCMFGSTGASAQTPASAPVVQSIQIQYVGPETVSEEKIRSNMRTRVGRPYSQSAVEEDIRTLYRTGGVSNVRIFGEPAAGGVRVIVVVAGKSSISEVLLNGVTRVKPDKLRDKMTLAPGKVLNDAAMEEDRQKILEYYQSKGYNDVVVSYRVENSADKRTARVIFDVQEGSVSKLDGVRFEGNVALSSRELQKVVKTKPKGLFDIFSSTAGKVQQDQLQADVAALTEYYQDRGYVDVEVKAPRIDRGTKQVTVVFQISEGRMYRVGRLTYSGVNVFSLDELTRGLKFREGSVYSPKALRDHLNSIRDAYGARGFLDVVINTVPAPAADGLVNINFALTEGTESYLEKIDITGNTRTKDKVIRRELAVAPGDLFNSVRVDASKKRLQNMNYFSTVETYPADTGVAGRKDLKVKVEEKRTGSFNFGAGFSSVDSILGFVELTQGNFDATNYPTFTGGGQKFRLRTQYGARRKDFIIALTEPYFMDQRLAVGGELFYRDFQFTSSDYDESRYGFTINVRKPIGVFASARAEYRLENVDINDVDPDASDEIRLEAGERLKSQVSIGLNYDTRDNIFLTRRGEKVEFTTSFAGSFLGGDTDTYGLELEASKYISLPWDTILLLEGQLGVVDGHGSGGVPIYDRLYLGGPNSMRGFAYRDVGPKDSRGEPIGGQSLARFTVEYTFPIVERVRGAFFYDVGFVNRDAYDFGSGDVNSDFGFGLRLEIPALGPVRLDYGIPIQSDDNNDSSGRFNFNIGYQF
jgi:outer membrane protein insertion porin family